MHWRRLWQWKEVPVVKAPPQMSRWLWCVRWVWTLPLCVLPLVEVSVRANKALLILLTSGLFTLNLMLHRQWQTGVSEMLEPRDIAFVTSFLLTPKTVFTSIFFPDGGPAREKQVSKALVMKKKLGKFLCKTNFYKVLLKYNWLKLYNMILFTCTPIKLLKNISTTNSLLVPFFFFKATLHSFWDISTQPEADLGLWQWSPGF